MGDDRVPLRLNPADTDAEFGRWRTAVRAHRTGLLALALAAGAALLAEALTRSTGPSPGALPDPVLALGLQAALGVAATPLLAAPAVNRRAAVTEWTLTGLALVLLALAVALLADRRGPGTALLQLGSQVAVQVLPQGVGSWLRAPRLLGDAAPGTTAGRLRSLLTDEPGRRRTVLQRWLARDGAGDLHLLAEEQWWDRTGRHSELVDHRVGPLVTAVRRGRRPHTVVELVFADGSRLGVRTPGVRTSRVLALAPAHPAPGSPADPLRTAPARLPGGPP